MRNRTVRYGRNRDLGWKDERHFHRCGRCGFICNTDRDKLGRRGSKEGWGIDASSTGGGWFDGDGWFRDGWFSDEEYLATVTDGCPQCGTLMYTSRRRSG